MILRSYQLDFVEAIRAEFRAGRRRVLGQAVTAFGKTVCFSFITQGAMAKGNRIVIVAHRAEILQQISDSLKSFGVDHAKIQSGEPIIPNYSVQVAAIQTLVNRMDKLPEPDLVVYDEVHHAANATSLKLFTGWPNAKYLGVTATPERLDGKGLGEFFESMVHGPPAAWLMDNGFLARPEYYGVPPSQALDFSDIPKVAGDFNKAKIAEVMDKPQITGSAVEHYRRICPGARAIAFCTTIDHARHVTAEFLAAGIPSEVIDGKLSDIDRAARVENLRTGVTRVMTSCELVSEGFDLPSVECAILLRPTWSLGLYLQMLGRILRPKDPGAYCVVLDHVKNWERHGFAEDVRNWSLEGKKTRQKSEAIVECRQCSLCFAVFQGPSCVQCGTVPEPKLRVIEEVAGTLSKITPEQKAAATQQRKDEDRKAVTYAELVDLAKKRNYPNPGGWAYFKFTRSWRKKAVSVKLDTK